MSGKKEINLIKEGQTLHPETFEDKALLGQYEDGDVIRFRIIKGRNLGHHRKFFAMLRFVRFNMPEHLTDAYRNEEQLLDEIKLKVGHSETRYRMDGTEWAKPKSINFESMDQNEFNEFYNRALDVVILDIMKGVTREDLITEIASFG